MADTDFVTEAQMNALVAAVAANAVGTATYVFHGAAASTPRPPVSGPVVWVGTVEPLNAITATDFYLDKN